MTALVAKFIAWGVFRIATWANPVEFGAAFATELGTFSVFKLAFRAFHPSSQKRKRPQEDPRSP
jgi:hypothetical protein